jgi:hypothetical protein
MGSELENRGKGLAGFVEKVERGGGELQFLAGGRKHFRGERGNAGLGQVAGFG